MIDSASNGWSQTLVMSFTKPLPPLVCTTKTDGKRRRVNRLVLLFEEAVQESLRSCCKSIFFPLEPPQRLMGIFYRSLSRVWLQLTQTMLKELKSQNGLHSYF